MSATIQPPVAKAQMLIRRPPAEVFEAFVDPAITSQFWFTHSSGRLEPGQKVRWDWRMYGVSTTVEVKAIEEGKRILIEWNGPHNPSLVEWRFEPRDDGHTLVRIRNWRFEGDANATVTEAIESAGGFSFVLAGAKAFLEHGLALNLIADHHPAVHATVRESAPVD
jgi:uncharacterized protein YndB with AHSA1/START domain